MVAEIQLLSYLYHEEVTPVHFTPSDKYSTDDQIALIAFLLNLEEYYNLYQTLTSEEILARIDMDMEELKQKMYSKTDLAINDGINSTFHELMDKYNIRYDWFGHDIAKRWGDSELIIASIDATINQLRDDLKVKCLAFESMALGDVLNIAPNFTRAVKCISDDIINNIGLARQKCEREILGFVFGEDSLYNWVCRNDTRTCANCRALAREAPRPLNEWPYDHPHGRCNLEPVVKKYSKDYEDYLKMFGGQ